MTMAVAWIVLPLVLALLSLGCGLLLEAVSGMRLPGALLLPGGFIVISLAAYFAHMTDATASLQTPLVIALSLAGYGLSRPWPWKRFQLDRWLAGAATGVYLVFGAPVLLSGQATFTGYIKLDDTATYMSMLDRASTHAYNLAGLHSSTYKAVLKFGYVFGYPLGSLLPLDVGQTILRVDPLWLWQPYLTFLAVLIALGLYQLVSELIQSRALRACVAFFGAQAALMYGYAAWGGVKELFLPSVVLFGACLLPRLRDAGPQYSRRTPGTASKDIPPILLDLVDQLRITALVGRRAIPLAAASAAVISGLSVGGGIWILPMIVVGLTLLVVNRPLEDAVRTIVVFAVTALFLAIPMLSIGTHRLTHIQKFLKGGEVGNLHHPLSWWQLPGIWPSGDFRDAPTNSIVTHVLAMLVVLAAIYAVVMAWRRGRWEIVVALATGVFACLIYVERASPWVAGKALASSSTLVLGVAIAGVAVLVENSRRVEVGGAALALLAVIAGGVLWSNVLQYHAVLLAPSSRLMELEQIGHKYSGQGPALLTEFEPYAARHFLRGLNGEAASELRVHPVYLRGASGRQASFGVSPDVDEIRLDALLYYHTLIIRRTGSSSRPPSVYKRVWKGRYYDVWQRPSGPSTSIITHLSIGSRFQPAGIPDCAKVKGVGRAAAAVNGVVKAFPRPQAIVIEPANGLHGLVKTPTRFGPYGEPGYQFTATNAYFRQLYFRVPSAGLYNVWIGGSFSNTVIATIDKREVGRQSNQTEWPGNFLSFGSVNLTRGTHSLGIKHVGPDLSPGSAAVQPFGLGPVVIAQNFNASGIDTVQPSNAQSLCGKSLDWVEAVRR